MAHWARPATLCIVGAACAFTLSPFIGEWYPDFLSRDWFTAEHCKRIGWILLPTVLFVASSLIAPRVGRTQLLVALLAAAVAAFVGSVCWHEIVHHVTGRGAYGVTLGTLALLVAPAPAAFSLILAIIAAVLHQSNPK